jgi:gliding motility-associated-like protein
VNGGYEFHFIGKLANLGNTNLDSIDVFYNLGDAFKSPDVAYLKNPPTITRGNFIFNQQYDGVNDTKLLHQSNNLQLGDSVAFEFDVVVNTAKVSATWLNQLTAKSYSTLDRIAIMDTSVAGLIVDPNKDDLGYETSYTRATLNYTYPLAPTVENLSFVYGTSPAKNVRDLIQSYPTGTTPVWCDLVTAKCDSVAPIMPTAIGRYIYELRSFDPASNLYSLVSSFDTIMVKPTPPVVKNRSYIIGLTTNPADISAQVVGLSNSSIRYYIQNTLQSTVPVILNTPATITYGVSQMVNSVESDKVNLTIQYLTVNDVVHLQKIAASSKVLPNGLYEVNYQFVVKNLINDTVSSISIKDDLANQLPIGVTPIVSSMSTSSYLQVNNLFNGQSVIELLKPASFILPMGVDTLSLFLQFDAGAYAGQISNQAILKLTTPYGELIMNSSDKTKSLEVAKNPTVFTLPVLSIKIAEGFSPNNDGIDDKWVIIKPYGTRISVRVFNRWGSEVYGNNNYQNNWDGRADKQLLGEYLPEGTYYYLVESFDSNGVQQKYNGSLTIVK